MSIGSVTSSSAATQASWISKFENSNSTSATGQAHRPPPPPDGGAMIGALADALQSIGVTATSAADDGTSTSTTSSDSGASSTSDSNVAQALGGFLHELMGALHAQGGTQGGSQSGAPPDGQAYGPPGGPGGAGGPGGPGRLSSDLQSLISELGSGTSSTTSSDTTSTDGTDSTSSTSTAASDSVDSLETSFKNLLQALGSDTSNSNDKLSSFLQTLANKLPGAGTSGNLVNTTV